MSIALKKIEHDGAAVDTSTAPCVFAAHSRHDAPESPNLTEVLEHLSAGLRHDQATRAMFRVSCDYREGQVEVAWDARTGWDMSAGQIEHCLGTGPGPQEPVLGGDMPVVWHGATSFAVMPESSHEI